ncbi:MAG: hypothetical protein LBH84_04370 [Prevotellaceae bacterium]|nr:hypothetical protein [Prevotellaceae bacterium]
MRIKKIFAVMLTAAAVSTAIVACNDDKEVDTNIVGTYEGVITVEGLAEMPMSIPNVIWEIKTLDKDTILITVPMLGVTLNAKAYGKREVTDSTLYNAIAPIQNLVTSFGTVNLDNGKVSYHHPTKISIINASGMIRTVTDTINQTYGNLPFAVKLTAPKKK